MQTQAIRRWCRSCGLPNCGGHGAPQTKPAARVLSAVQNADCGMVTNNIVSVDSVQVNGFLQGIEEQESRRLPQRRVGFAFAASMWALLTVVLFGLLLGGCLVATHLSIQHY